MSHAGTNETANSQELLKKQRDISANMASQILNSIIVHDLDLDVAAVQREVDKISYGATLCEPSGRDCVRIYMTDPQDITLLSGQRHKNTCTAFWV